MSLRLWDGWRNRWLRISSTRPRCSSDTTNFDLESVRMQRPLLVSLTLGTVISEENEARLKVQSPRGTISLDAPTPGLRLALRSLANRGMTEDERAGQVLETDG